MSIDQSSTSSICIRIKQGICIVILSTQMNTKIEKLHLFSLESLYILEKLVNIL